jgi:HSP20 family protein
MTVVVHAAREDKFASVAKQVGRWMDQVLGPGFRKYSPGESWAPAINLCEDETHYCVVVELAGVTAEEIDLQTEGRKLILSGFREAPGLPESGGNVRLHHMEIDHGVFSRSLELPTDADMEDADRIEAVYRLGFLWIHIPKRP